MHSELIADRFSKPPGPGPMWSATETCPAAGELESDPARIGLNSGRPVPVYRDIDANGGEESVIASASTSGWHQSRYPATGPLRRLGVHIGWPRGEESTASRPFD